MRPRYRTRFRYGSAAQRLSLTLHRSNSPDHNAKGTQSAVTQPEGHAQPPTACMYAVSGSLSLPALGCFSPVPHGTRSLSVTRESLALEGGPPSFTPDSSELGRYSGNPLVYSLVFAYRAITVYGAPFQETSADTRTCRMWLLQPHHSQGVMVWARAPFARRYLGHLG